MKQITSTFLTLGIIVAALTVAFLIEFGRSDEIRTQALIETCFLSLISYFTPALWLRSRGKNNSQLAWLIVPNLGSVLIYLIVVLIPNEISIWNQSSGRTFIADAMDSFPSQLFRFFFAFLLLSGISSIIVGASQLMGLGFVAMRRLLNKDLLSQNSRS